VMYGREKSDSAIVAMKPANNAGQPAAEWVERRAEAEGNTVELRTRRTLSRESVSQGLDRVRHAALRALPSFTRGGSPVRYVVFADMWACGARPRSCWDQARLSAT
jgi:hypothetical protein